MLSCLLLTLCVSLCVHVCVINFCVQPGNLMVLDDKTKGDLAILDFGLMAEIDKKDMEVCVCTCARVCTCVEGRCSRCCGGDMEAHHPVYVRTCVTCVHTCISRVRVCVSR